MKKQLSMLVFFIVLILLPGLIYSQSSLQLEFSTFLGGNNADNGNGIALDYLNNIYITGDTCSYNFPTFNSYQSSMINSYTVDAFIACLPSSGSSLIYSTFLGGDGYDTANAIAVNDFNQACVTGKTYSGDFPLQDPWDGILNGDADVFVTLLSSSGSSLSFSTYLGGTNVEAGIGIAIDKSGYIYICGSTSSVDFPTDDPFQASYGGGSQDGFVTQFTPSGSLLYYSTYLGGNGSADSVNAVAVDEDYYAYLTGETDSDDFPTENPYQSSRAGGYEVFVSKLDKGGDALIYSTYLGGASGAEGGNAVCLDNSDSAYITGYTSSDDFPVYNAYQMTPGGEKDVFVAHFSSSGSNLYYSTYIGGSKYEQGTGIAVIPDYGDSYITGSTKSIDFPTSNAFQSTFSGGVNWGDSFLVNLGSDGDRLHGSTYLGGPNDDGGNAVVLDSNNHAYIVGSAGDNFPLRNPYQSVSGGGADVFISKFYWGTPPVDLRGHTDFNGDGTSDIAVFRDSSGLWAIRGISRLYFGGGGDLPKPADYNGDGTTDVGIFRASSGLWAIRSITRFYFGSTSDLPVPGDYNGNGSADPAIFRASTGLWAVRFLTRLYFGGLGDTAAPGYYNSDDNLDVAIFRASSGLWSARGITRVYFGGSSDTAKAGDYSGDGIWEPAIFRASSGLWAIKGLTRVYFGGVSDLPVPADYRGGTSDDIGIFRESSGLWAIRGISRIYYGNSGDIPVTR